MSLLFIYFIMFSYSVRQNTTFLMLIMTLINSLDNPEKHMEGPPFSFYRWGNQDS